MKINHSGFKKVVLVAAVNAAFAQAQAEELVLEVITVTAQKREQTLQEVPVAVSVLNGDALQDLKISGLDSMDNVVPNLVVTKSPFQPFVAIRGLGSGAGTRAFEQSVALYVDGVYSGKANQFLNPFFDVNRIEVVKGPQSVLFGVNAIAGAINVVSKKPTDQLEYYVSAGYETENDGHSLEGGVSLPVSDTLAVRVSGKTQLEGGYLDNTVTGKEEPETDSDIARMVISWQPTEDLTLDTILEGGKKTIEGAGFQTVYLPLPIFSADVEDGNLDFTKSTPGTANFTKLKTKGAIVNITYALDNSEISSTTGFSKYDFDQALPAGSVPSYFGTALDDEEFKQYYQEVRLVSDAGGAFDYILGGSYYHQKVRMDQGIDFDFTSFGAPSVTAAVRNSLAQTTEGYSVFGQLTYRINDRVNVVAGLRYSDITKEADYLISPTTVGSPLSGYTFDATSLFVLSPYPTEFFQYFDSSDLTTFRASSFSRKRKDDALNPSVSVNYEISDSVSSYLSYTTGTKSGGFNDQEKSAVVPEEGFAEDAFEFDKEDAKNYELGFKGQTDSTRFNIALFHTKYEDLQASQATPGGSIRTTNAASASADGIEGDVTWLVSQGLTLNASAAYIDAQYDDYPGSGCIISISPSTCVATETNAAGGDLIGVPEITASFSAEYVRPVFNNLELRTYGRLSHNDGAQWQSNQDPLDRTPSYTLLDASVGLSSETGWSVSVTGKNLTDEVYQGFTAPAASAFFGHQSLVLPGRQIFLDIRYDY